MVSPVTSLFRMPSVRRGYESLFQDGRFSPKNGFNGIPGIIHRRPVCMAVYLVSACAVAVSLAIVPHAGVWGCGGWGVDWFIYCPFCTSSQVYACSKVFATKLTQVRTRRFVAVLA